MGIYEVKLVRLHTSKDERDRVPIDLLPDRDYARCLFEIVADPKDARPNIEIELDVQERERQIEQRFLSPLEVRSAGTEPTGHFFVLVFLKDILIGTRMRLDRYEIVPTNTGLETRDHLSFVNSFLANSTRAGITFEYSSALSEQSKRSNPVCVVHFPHILAQNAEAARDYCSDCSNALLQALALSRSAGGQIFSIVAVDLSNSAAIEYSFSSNYVGNLLTGHLAGESADSLSAYLKGLALDPVSRFLVDLYKEANREKSPDFKYVRYWQILETMADGENYNDESDLTDYEGQVMLDGTSARKSKGSVHIVFRLLRDAGIGSTDQTWKNVNVWFAFRNAVAHHGSITQSSSLSKAKVREWALSGLTENAKTPGHDQFLFALKEDLKLLLMRKLISL